LHDSGNPASYVLADLFFVKAANATAERYRAVVRGYFDLTQGRQVPIRKKTGNPLLKVSIRGVNQHSVGLHLVSP